MNRKMKEEEKGGMKEDKRRKNPLSASKKALRSLSSEVFSCLLCVLVGLPHCELYGQLEGTFHTVLNSREQGMLRAGNVEGREC